MNGLRDGAAPMNDPRGGAAPGSGAEERGREARVLVEAKDVSVRLRGRLVLEGIDLTVSSGEIVTLIGPNGSGKTTLVRTVLGLLEPDQGRVVRAPGLSVGYVPQTLAIDDSLPLTVRRFLLLGGRAGEARLSGALAEVGADGLLDAPVQQVSGGQLKRILLARALLREPALLVLDEPGAGVDVTGQSAFYRLIRTIRDRHHCGILLVSHDLHLVMAATDRVVCLNRHVCCHGVPESVTRHPEYLALFGDAPVDGLAVYTHHHDHTHDLTGLPHTSHDHGEHDHIHDHGEHNHGHDHGGHKHG